MLKRRPRLAGLAGLMLVGSLVAVTGGVAVAGQANAHQSHALVSSGGIHKIKHVVVIMQENRSFDSYFGTYPGADGIPMRNGVPTVCVPDPKRGSCAKPYHDRADLNGGGPHFSSNARDDINSGRLDGFIAQAERGRRGCLNAVNPACTNSTNPDVMGYHNGSDIPNYWAYAKNYV